MIKNNAAVKIQHKGGKYILRCILLIQNISEQSAFSSDGFLQLNFDHLPIFALKIDFKKKKKASPVTTRKTTDSIVGNNKTQAFQQKFKFLVHLNLTASQELSNQTGSDINDYDFCVVYYEICHLQPSEPIFSK